MELTEKQRKALQIFSEHPHLRASDFGKIMWKDSPARQKVHNIGHGSTRGIGLWFAAGGFIAKLKNKGYLRDCPIHNSCYCFELTYKGKTALASPPLSSPSLKGISQGDCYG